MNPILNTLLYLMISAPTPGSPLQQSKDFFQKLSLENIDLVDQFYAADTVFQDPIHRVVGAKSVKEYYKALYSNVKSIRFEYGKGIESGSTVSLEWKMFLVTDAIANGQEITVDGVSLIKFNKEGKAIEHRDYFDMGEFIYERVPVLGSIIRYIKKRMAGNSSP